MPADARQPEQATCDDKRSDRDGQPWPNASHEPRGDLGRDDNAHAERQECEPRLQRAVAEHVLDDLAQEEQDGERRGSGHHSQRERAAAVPVREDAQRHQRLAAAQLDEKEKHQQRSAQTKRRDGQVVGPGVRGGARQAIHEQRHGTCDRDRSGQVEAASAGFGGRKNPRCDGCEHQGDGDVDEQDPPPRQVVDDDAAEDQADRAAAAGRAGVHAEGTVACGALLEGVGDQGECGGGDDRAAGALDDTRRDQPRRCRGQPAGE